MNEHELLTDRFGENRARLYSVAHRMLGSASEADDAVQETWLRLHRAGASDVDNLGGWMTTVVARVCLDMLRSRTARREDPLDSLTEAGDVEDGETPDPEQEALLADSLGPALLTVLDTMAPAERVAFVLHDVFRVPFDEIAGIVGRSPDAARQLASRARRRVAGSAVAETDRRRQGELVRAFLDASRRGDLRSLIGMLDPDAVLRPDRNAADNGAARAAGAQAVARVFSGRMQAAKIALIDGSAGVIWAPGGRLRAVFRFSLGHDKITAIELLTDPDVLDELDVVLEIGER